MKVLVCGERSFVGGGFAEKLVLDGFDVDTFSRGETEGRCGRSVSGSVFDMAGNQCLSDSYDAVVNFIFINKGTVEENLEYARSLHKFCETHQVKRLVQISSISEYPNDAVYVDENTPIETDGGKKGQYAIVKMAVDAFFARTDRHYQVVTIRAGYVVSDEREVKTGGIVMPVAGKIGLLLGNRRTSLPLVEKDKIHEGLIRILKKANPKPVYLFLEGCGGTKADFAAKYWNGVTFPLPKCATILAARILGMLHVFSRRQVEMVNGLFKATFFDPSESEYDLGMSFTKNSVGVVGSGAFGSYTIQRLSELPVSPYIWLYEAGNGRIKDESAIGYASNIKGARYTGLQKGRFFGFGGATAKWGGQIVMFSKNDFKNPDRFLKEIVELNERYHDKVYARFGFRNLVAEHNKAHGMFTKTGIWLGYFSRNLFKKFRIAKKKRVRIVSDARVARLLMSADGKSVAGIEYIRSDGRVKHAFHDRYFLCAGAFESNRIVLSSGMAGKNEMHFSDQLSQQVFGCSGPMVIDGEDYQYGIRGTSLVTNRLIGEIEGISFFAHPVYNNDFPFFRALKELMFQGKRNLSVFAAIVRNMPSVIGFAWSIFVKRKIYVYKNKWNISIDIENDSADSNVSLSAQKDKWGLPALDVDFKIGSRSQSALDDVRKTVQAYLDESGVAYTELSDDIHVEKGEDIYHPYGMYMSDSLDLDDYFTRYSNLLIVNTGVLPRAGGLNTTAVCFPLIEEYVERYFQEM